MNTKVSVDQFEGYDKFVAKQKALELLLKITKMICASWMALNLLACATAPEPIVFDVTNPTTGQKAKVEIPSLDEFDKNTRAFEATPESKVAVVEQKVEVAAAVALETIPVTPPPDYVAPTSIIASAAPVTAPLVTKLAVIEKKASALNPQMADAFEALIKHITETKTVESLAAVNKAMPHVAAEVIKKAAPLPPVKIKKSETMLASVPKPESAMAQVVKLKPVFIADELFEEESQPPAEKQLAAGGETNKLTAIVDRPLQVVETTAVNENKSSYSVLEMVVPTLFALILGTIFLVVAHEALSDISRVFGAVLMQMATKRRSVLHGAVENIVRAKIDHSSLAEIHTIQRETKPFTINVESASSLGLALPHGSQIFYLPLLVSGDTVSIDGVAWIKDENKNVHNHLKCPAAKAFLVTSYGFTKLGDPYERRVMDHSPPVTVGEVTK